MIVATARNVGLWVVIAILCYFTVEMLFGLKPLEIAVGKFTVPASSVTFVALLAFISVRLWVVLRAGR